MNEREIERQLHLAQQQMSQGQLEGATKSLRQVLTFAPDEADAHALLSICLLGLRRVHGAEYEAEMALSLDPESLLALEASADVLMARRKFKPAEKRFRELLERKATSPSVYRGLADLYRLTGRHDRARAWLDKALELEPGAAETWADLGFWHLRYGDLDTAEVKARKALEISPEHHNGLLLMGHILVQRGHVEEARDHAIWALRQDPTDKAALYLMAAIKARKSVVLGLWWRYSTWMGNLGDGRAILVLLTAYVLYRFGVITATGLEHPDLAQYIQFLWLAIVAYTWIGPVVFGQSLKRELAEVKLDREF